MFGFPVLTITQVVPHTYQYMPPELRDIPDGLTCYHIPGLQNIGFVSLSLSLSLSELGLSQSEEVKFTKQWMFNTNIMSFTAAPVPLLKDKLKSSRQNTKKAFK
jgi:hypothetical protein